MPPPTFTDDENVTATLKSIATAEEITGGKFPEPKSEEELKKMKEKETPEYHLADSDDEEDDGGDSTLETRRSIKTVENRLKQRWFINAKEKREFEEKVAKGLIRPEVLDFTDKSDSDPQESAQQVFEKEAAKQKAVADAAADKAAKEADAKKDPKQKAEEAAEKADAAAKEAAKASLEKEDKAAAEKAAADAAKAKPADKPKEEAKPEGEFIPPELQGAM